MSDLTVEIIHPSGLPGADLATWRELQAATPAFGNPLLGPDFAQAVGAVRKDARVAIWRGGGGVERPPSSPIIDDPRALAARLERRSATITQWSAAGASAWIRRRS